MYSGYNLIYGIELTIEDVLFLFNLDGDEDVYFLQEIVNDILIDRGFHFLKFIKKPCCYHESFSVFIGADLGSNLIQYRSNVEVFDDFQLYDDFFQTKLDVIKNNYNKNKQVIDEEFNEFIRMFWENEEGLPPKQCFFTIPDDCESCT
jgi:hypothetical protein